MTDVLYFGNDFLTDVAALVVTDPRLAEFRHGRRRIDVDAIDGNAGFSPHNIPGSMVDCRGARLSNGADNDIGLCARNPDLISDIGRDNPAVVQRAMRITLVQIRGLANPGTQ